MLRDMHNGVILWKDDGEQITKNIERSSSSILVKIEGLGHGRAKILESVLGIISLNLAGLAIV